MMVMLPVAMIVMYTASPFSKTAQKAPLRVKAPCLNTDFSSFE